MEIEDLINLNEEKISIIIIINTIIEIILINKIFKLYPGPSD